MLRIIILFITFNCCYGQNKINVISALYNVDRLIHMHKLYKNSSITNENFKLLLYKKLEDDKNEKLEDQKIQTLDSPQEDTKHEDSKENEEKIDLSKKNKSIIVSIFEEETEDDRLFGPSQYDSRIEIFSLNPEIFWQKEILENSFSIGIIVEKNKITLIKENTYQLEYSNHLGKIYNLCTNEPFYYQPVIGIGTAWLFKKNQMISARHVFESSIENYVIMFGYKILNEKGVVDIYFSNENIFNIKKIIKEDYELDLVSFELDRETNFKPLEFEKTSNEMGKDTEIVMLGYPSGLPLKLSVNASIVENNHTDYFYTSLDSFQGNSGSPVFNFYTNKVIGVLVSGEIDYQYNGNCNESTLCKYPYCKGEKVIKISRFFD